MAVAVNKVAQQFLNVQAGVAIPVAMQAFEASDIRVIYGITSQIAVQNVDYTISLANDFNTFTIVPTASLIAKINALIIADPSEQNYITVRRELDLLTESTAALSRYTPFTSREHDRSAMRDQQLNDKINRSLQLGDRFVGGSPLLTLAELEPDRVLMVDPTGTQLIAGPNANEIENAQAYAERAEAAAAAVDITFDDLPALLAYPTVIPTGKVIRTKSEGYLYQVVLAGAAHLQTPAGTYLRVLLDNGRWSFGALNPAGNNVADDRPKFVIAQSIGGVMFLPKPAVSYRLTSALQLLNMTVEPDPLATWTSITGAGMLTWTGGRGTGEGAQIRRYKDRVFVGRAADTFAGNSVSNDIGTSVFSSEAQAPAYIPINAQLLVEAGPSQYAIGAAAQGSRLQGVGVITFGASLVNDKAGGRAWGIITEIQHEPGALNANGAEFAIKNKSAQNTQYTPYSAAAGTFGARFVAGSDATFGGIAANPCTAAMVVIKNHNGGNVHGWNSGLVFFSDALTGTDGSAGSNSTAEAIGMARNHAINWHTPDGLGIGAAITSRVVNYSNRMWQYFIDDAIVFQSLATGNAVFRMQHAPNGVNYLQASNGATGSAAVLTTQGPDTNIDLRLNTKGTGVIQFGTYVATVSAITGYVLIKDLTGVQRKLAVIS